MDFRFDLFEQTHEPAMTAGKVKSREIIPVSCMQMDCLREVMRAFNII